MTTDACVALALGAAPPSTFGNETAPVATQPDPAQVRRELRLVFNLKWLLLFAGSLVVLAVCGALGLLRSLWDADTTKISFVILGLYLMVSPFIGWLTAHAPGEAVTDYRQACRYTPELMVSLGMLGTVIGFLMMLGLAFKGLDPSNVQTAQAAMARIASGIAVALSTTLVGLACSMLVQLQLVNLDIARRP